MSVPMKAFGIVVMADDDVGVIGGTMMVGMDVIDGLIIMGDPDGPCPATIIEVTGPLDQG